MKRRKLTIDQSAVRIARIIDKARADAEAKRRDAHGQQTSQAA